MRDEPKEIPVLFKGNLVLQILRGQKTETRRVVKGLASQTAIKSLTGGSGSSFIITRSDHQHWTATGSLWALRSLGCTDVANHGLPRKYREGDVLWVRESFVKWEDDPEWDPGDETKECDPYTYIAHRAQLPGEIPTVYRHRHGRTVRIERFPIPDGLSWRPSIHMPRWACRLRVEITEVRIEPLHDIRPAAIIAEGLTDGEDLMERWIDLWDRINAPRGYSWAKNPWVRVVRFRRIEHGEGGAVFASSGRGRSAMPRLSPSEARPSHKNEGCSE